MREVVAYGVPVSGQDGKAGMVALIVEGRFSARTFAEWTDAELPTYARPVFVRLLKSAETTGTFKYRKTDLVADGFDPAKIDGPLYVRGGKAGYARLTDEAYAAILRGDARF